MKRLIRMWFSVFLVTGAMATVLGHSTQSVASGTSEGTVWTPRQRKGLSLAAHRVWSLLANPLLDLPGVLSVKRQLCFDQGHNYTPSVLPKGRVVYLRWD